MVLVLHERDSVAVALRDIPRGQVIKLPDGQEIVARTDIPYSHKVAITDLAADATIYKYGEVIGRADGAIQTGDWIHTHNLKD